MFDDIVLNYAPFADFCRKLGRPLRVATMCSGTESPMLALAMLSRAVEAQGPDSMENIMVFGVTAQKLPEIHSRDSDTCPRVYFLFWTFFGVPYIDNL